MGRKLDFSAMRLFWAFFGAIFATKLKFESKGVLGEDCQENAYPAERVLYQPKTHQINLDLTPKERWVELGKIYSQQLQGTLATVIEIVNKLNSKIVPYLEEHLPTFAETFPKTYVDEMSGLSKGSGVPLGDIILYNIFYEIFSMCTSIVAKDKDGGLIHARNLDFGLFVGWDFQNMTWPLAEALRPGVITMEFQKNNKTLYTSAGFIGYIGVFTGVKAGQFSFSANERFDLNGGYVGIIEWILGKHSAQWLGFFSRDVFDQCDTYACAKKQMMNLEMVSPVYFILADGSSQNAITIVRDREQVAGSVALGSVKDSTKSGSWFLLQTNYDPWKSPPFFDDRRNPGIKCMNKGAISEGKGAKYSTKEAVFDVLSTKPNLNMLTVYTSVMDLTKGTIETYIRECPFPCSPW